MHAIRGEGLIDFPGDPVNGEEGEKQGEGGGEGVGEEVRARKRRRRNQVMRFGDLPPW